jgi:pimeloyl-ACP methyl ester carboxylesterase
MIRKLLAAFAATLGLFVAGCATPTSPDSMALTMEEFMVPSDPGIEVYVRNKHPAGMREFSPERTVLFVHGATYPAHTAFDLKLGGMSWMDYMARRGYDVYLIDLRGYGRSTRPPLMSQDAKANPPFATTEDVMRDVDAAVDFIRKRRGVAKVNLLAWSWGTAITQWYTANNAAKVNKLALYAPVWIRTTPSLVQAGAGPTPAYRMVEMSQAKTRWLTGVAADKQAGLIPPGWFEAWADETLKSDPDGSRRNPPVIRAPNGVVADGLRYWGNNNIPWDPAKITVPVLLVKGEWDVDTPASMAQALFPKLTGAPYKRYIEIGEGTHTLIMEKNRLELFEAVQQFFDERYRPAQ